MIYKATNSVSARTGVIGFLIALAAMAGFIFGIVHVAQGAPQSTTYTVNRTDDIIVTTCLGGVKDCSLRGAVQLANANPGSTIILQYNTVYTISLGELNPLADMSIVAGGNCNSAPCYATIQGVPGFFGRILDNSTTATVTLDHIKITNGNSGAYGGGIYNAGTLNLLTCIVTSNHAVNAGGIYNIGALHIYTSTISVNSSLSWGGGVYNYTGTTTIDSSILLLNTSQIVGAGLLNEAGIVTFTHSIASHNQVTGTVPGQGSGGGIVNINSIDGAKVGRLTIQNNSLIDSNVAAGGGGGGLYSGGIVNTSDTTIVDNQAIDGAGADIVSGTATFSNVIFLTNTTVITGWGGGLYSYDPVTITNSLFQGNAARYGGGIENSAQMWIYNTQFIGNSANNTGGGGAIRSDVMLIMANDLLDSNVSDGGGGIAGHGVLSITDSTLSNNHASGSGGGLFVTGLGGDIRLERTAILSNSASYGAGIFNFGDLTLRHVTIQGGTGYQGGGIYNSSYGTLTADGSIAILNNSTSGGSLNSSHGAGIFNDGLAFITGTVVASNTASNGGGSGIFNSGTGAMALVNVTVSGNKAKYNGGGIASLGALRLNNATIAYNSADANNTGSGTGGGISTTLAVTIANSIVATNTGASLAANDCAGTLSSQGYNLIQTMGGCTIAGSQTGIITGQDPQLGPLAQQGDTLVHALLSSSPAINTGNPLTPGSGGLSCAAFDQRGVARPVGPKCDIGAYEVSFLTYLPYVRR